MVRIRPLTLASIGMLLACGSRDPAAPLQVTHDEARGVAFVEPEEVRGYVEAGHADEVVFVDNRGAFAYSQARIAGARLMPTNEMPRSVGNLPLNKWLVMYCT